MCDPGTLAIAATVMSVAGTVTSTVAQAQQARYEAAIAEQNRKMESQKAQDAIERGNIEARDASRRQSQLMGAQRAAMAANGIDLSFGSAADTLADTAMFAEDERMNIRENTRREVMGFDVNAMNYQAQAIASRRAATGALISGAFQVGSTIAGGAQKFGKIQAARKAGGSGWGAL